LQEIVLKLIDLDSHLSTISSEPIYFFEIQLNILGLLRDRSFKPLSVFFKLNTTSQTDENTLVLTGTGFDISGFTASAEFGGVTADSVTIDSATQATATFSWGVPIGTGSPRITFDSDSDTYL
jgi:hypothetical protein